MTKQDLKSILLQQYKSGRFNANFFNKKTKLYNQDIIDDIIYYTNFLPYEVPMMQRVYHIINDIYETQRCYCGNLLKYDISSKKYKLYCSQSCARSSKERKKKVQETWKSKPKDVIEDIVQKNKQTKLKNHGSEKYVNVAKRMETISNRTPEEREMTTQKRINTNIQKYGVDNAAKSSIIRKKISDKWKSHTEDKRLEIYKKRSNTYYMKTGFIHQSKDPQWKSKVIETNLNRYGVRWFVNPQKQKETIKEKYGSITPNRSHMRNTDDFNEEFIKSKFVRNGAFHSHEFIEYFGVLGLSNISSYKEYFNIKEPTYMNTRKSKPQKEVLDFIKSLDVEVISDTKKVISPLELDIFIPSYNVAIEFNGLYWHSYNTGTNITYHKNKTSKCQEKGIHLFHIFEDQWNTKKSICKSMIKAKLNLLDNKIYARKCEIKEVDSKVASKFLDENHLQGRVGSTVKIGLYFNDKLVSLMTFMRIEDSVYELSRFCNLLIHQW